MDRNQRLALIMFKNHGYQQRDFVSKQQLQVVLNNQATKIIHKKFNSDILQQIWGQAQTNSKGQATAFTFSKIYAQAISIIDQRIMTINGPTGIQKNQLQLYAQQDKLEELQRKKEKGLLQNQDGINTALKNIAVLKNKQQELQKTRQEFQKELNELKACIYVPEVPSKNQLTSPLIDVVKDRFIKADESIHKEHLSQIFIASVIGVCAQFAFMSFHPSFLAVLSYLLVVFWLFLGYYDKNFVKLLTASLIITCLMDVTYIYFFFRENIGSHRYCDPQTFWRYVSIVILILELFLRVYLMQKLFIFKQPSADNYYFKLFDHKIKLNTRSGKVFSTQIGND